MQELTTPFEKHFEPENTPQGVQSLAESPSYEIAYYDRFFLESHAARGVRIISELEKPEWHLQQYGIRSTVIVFGSARFISREAAEKKRAAVKQQYGTPDSPAGVRAVREAELALEMSAYYEQAREFARIVGEANGAQHRPENDQGHDFVICTGGGPGIMEAANRGAFEAGVPSIGLNIKLPYEQKPNPYIAPPLCFQFHYFAIRKLHFMLRAKALVVCPGGFGTFDELFEALTLRQTERMQPIPIIIFGEKFWRSCLNFDHLVATGVIDEKDLALFRFTESPAEAWQMIKEFHTVAETG